MSTNTVCPKGTKLSTINISPGYWRRNTKSLNIVQCKFKEFCLGGILQNTTCKKVMKVLFVMYVLKDMRKMEIFV